jgi:hypothetical protein
MRILLLIVLCGLAGCATSRVVVNTNVNPDKDFTTYETFGFLQPLSTDRVNGARTPVSTQLINSMRDELESRGLRESAAPDLAVNFYIDMETRVRVEQVRQASSFHHYRRGRYNTWQNYQTAVTQYTAGTLAIDFIDIETNILAWEGAADGRMRQNLSDFSQEQVDDIVGAVMVEFPLAPVGEEAAKDKPAQASAELASPDK